jgi:hypothetical protein
VREIQKKTCILLLIFFFLTTFLFSCAKKDTSNDSNTVQSVLNDINLNTAYPSATINIGNVERRPTTSIEVISALSKYFSTNSTGREYFFPNQLQARNNSFTQNSAIIEPISTSYSYVLSSYCTVK